MFWDLRVQSLETQALEPLKAIDEMRGSAFPEDRAIPAVLTRLNAVREYRRLFARAFGGNAAVTEQNLGRALAAFQRSLVATKAPFDRYMRGDTTALSPEQLRAASLAEPDFGVNKTFAFRTPSLRHLGATAPYMHNGAFATLPEVINFYQRISRSGGRGTRAVNLQVSRDQVEPLARALRMGGRGQRDLIALLGALDDPGFDRTIPQRVPSALPVGGRLRP